MKVDITALRKSLPKMSDADAEKFEAQMPKTLKNITLRVSPQIAAKLVYLDVCVGIPKATAVKRCIDASLDEIWRQTSEAGIQMAALSIETKS